MIILEDKGLFRSFRPTVKGVNPRFTYLCLVKQRIADQTGSTTLGNQVVSISDCCSRRSKNAIPSCIQTVNKFIKENLNYYVDLT